MTKYKIVKESKALPVDCCVGSLIEDNKVMSQNGKNYVITDPHLQALIELGVVEEVKEVEEWNPRELKDGQQYFGVNNMYFEAPVGGMVYYSNERRDKYNVAIGNCHPTKEAAEAWRDKLLADYK